MASPPHAHGPVPVVVMGQRETEDVHGRHADGGMGPNGSVSVVNWRTSLNSKVALFLAPSVSRPLPINSVPSESPLAPLIVWSLTLAELLWFSIT